MTDYYVAYRDIEDRQPRRTFELMALPPAGALAINDQVVPGWFGAKPMHIRWYHQRLGRDTLHLLTYTHADLEDEEVQTLLEQAYKLTQERRLP
jgi:hypothetical protein